MCLLCRKSGRPNGTWVSDATLGRRWNFVGPTRKPPAIGWLWWAIQKNNSPILVDLSKTIISTKVGFNHHLATNTVTRVFINQHTLTSKSKFEQQNSWFNKRNAWQNQLRIGNNSGAPKFTFGFFTLSKFVECFNIRFLHLEKHISDTTNCLLSRWS